MKSNPITTCSVSVLRVLASLKIAVTMFGLSVALIYIGTLAQVEHDIWKVMEDYFQPWLVHVPASVLFPESWFPNRYMDIKPEDGKQVLPLLFAVTALVAAGLTFFNTKAGNKQIIGITTILGIGFGLALITVTKGSFPFPGGATIGSVMLVNLIAAHLVRFKIRVRGAKLGIGIALFVLGVLVTATVIIAGHDSDGGIQGKPPIAWKTLWTIWKGVLSAVSAIMFLNWIRPSSESQNDKSFKRLFGVIGIISGMVSVWLWATDENSYVGDSGMRVLWNLMQATFAGSILLSGCYFLFQKRAGVVTLHLGVILLMFGQWFVTNFDVEQQINLQEQETKAFAHDIRRVELAVICESEDDPEKEDVVAIPLCTNGNLTSHVEKKITVKELPFEIEVEKFFVNSTIERLEGKDSPVANSKGDGLEWKAVERKSVRGTDGGSVNVASAYIKIMKSGKSLGTYLVSQELRFLRSGRMLYFDAEQFECDGKTYDLQLRFKRINKPYAVKLIDVKKEDYLGTERPKHYSSTVEITDIEKGVEHDADIWMNNPLRYGGETFYQNNFGKDPVTGVESTTLLVVKNQGWMIPYVSCMICAVGMLFHFGQILLRFINRTSNTDSLVEYGILSGDVLGIAALAAIWTRRGMQKMQATKNRREKKASQDKFEIEKQEFLTTGQLMGRLIPLLLLSLSILFIAAIVKPKTTTYQDMNLSEFGRLPIVFGGRAKPIDSFARNSLKQLSEKQSFNCRYSPDELQENWDDVVKSVVAKWPKLQGLKLSDFESTVKNTNTEALIDHIRKEAKPSDSASIEGLIRIINWYSPTQLLEKWPEVLENWPELQGLQLSDFETSSKESTVQGLIDHIGKVTGEEDSNKIADQIEKMAAKRQPAIRWLLDFVCDPTVARQHRVIRITDLGVLKALKLPNRKGFQYSLDDLIPNIDTFSKEVQAIREKGEEGSPDLIHYQRKILGLEKKINYLTMVSTAYREMLLPVPYSPEKVRQLLEQFQPAEEKVQFSPERLQQVQQELQHKLEQEHIQKVETQLSGAELPLIVAPLKPGVDNANLNDWQAFAVASPLQESRSRNKKQINPGFENLRTIFSAYKKGDAQLFNDSVQTLHRKLADGKLEALATKSSFTNAVISQLFGNFYRFEAAFNRVAPFFWCAFIYLFAFILLPVGWLFKAPSLIKSSYVLLVFTFVIHTLALIARIYLSGRPPVTNLYSSAVFIGWGLVLLALVTELFFRKGFMSLIAACMGFAALLIAHFLGISEGDTFGVLQAVLDTQFWLATHVVCITLGYATTFLAGGLACTFLLGGMFTPQLGKSSRKELSRMIYGTVCFSILFSFIGTILGGLWADDSWGRFWGWDPKENGALIIVLWNALVLHARWGGMVKDRGFAVLAMAGNIATAWSWFGVNELNVGLHAYGRSEGRMFLLCSFIAIQTGMIVLACLPTKLWWSYRRDADNVAVAQVADETESDKTQVDP